MITVVFCYEFSSTKNLTKHTCAFWQGHDVTLFNRGKTALQKFPRESESDFAERSKATKYIKGDRKDAAVSPEYSEFKATVMNNILVRDMWSVSNAAIVRQHVLFVKRIN